MEERSISLFARWNLVRATDTRAEEVDSTPRRSKLLDVYTYISCVPSWRVTRYRLRERLRVPLYTYSTSHENASVVGMLPRNENEEKIWRIQTSNVFNRNTTNDFRPLVKNSKNRLQYKEKGLEEERFDKDDAWTIQLCNFLKLTYDCSQFWFITFCIFIRIIIAQICLIY